MAAMEKKDKNLNVPNLRFPEFSGEWERCTIGDITRNFSLRNKDKIQYPMFSVTNSRGFVPQSEQFEDREMIGEDIKAYKIIHEGDFAYNPARINVGSIAKYDKSEPCMISSLYVCFKALPQINNEWLMQLLKTPKMNFYYNVNGEGGVRVYLFYPNFARIRTSYPSLAEQQKIASFLSLLDQRIETQRKIIEKYESLIRGLITSVNKGEICKCKATALKDVLTEVHEKNVENHEVCSVSVSQGVINQIDYLGRSFAAKEVLHYNVVNYGDVVYTKSPTGEFPYGIVKRSNLDRPVAVSPLYGVYRPVNDYVGIYLHLYFKSPVNTKNYLHRLIQKGAKNTINITNQHFLDNQILIPEHGWLEIIVNAASTIEKMIQIECDALLWLERQKNYLLSKMFI